MDVASSLQKVIFAVAESQSLDAVLQMIVRGLGERPEVALARIWLTAPGDICATCHMRSICPDQSSCLHLMASAGNPFIGTGSAEANGDAWSRTDGHFRRMPLNAPLKIGYAGGTGQSVLIHIQEGQEKQPWIARPDWVREQKIRTIAAQPLIFNKQILGVLGVFSRNQISEPEFTWLRAFADQVAVAITTARNADQLRALLDISNALITHRSWDSLLHAVSGALQRAVAVDGCGLSLYLPDQDVFRLMAVEAVPSSDYFVPGRELRRAENSVGWVFEHQQPLVHRDLEQEQQYANERRLAAEGMRSYCAVPLIVSSNCIGVLTVVSRKAGQYSAAHVDFLREIANQVALAVENLKAYQEITALKDRLAKENVYLVEEVRTDHNFGEIVGENAALRRVLKEVETVAPTDSTVLICGETGTGKELVARALHDLSPRRDRTFVKLNCAAIPTGLLESELFGHEKGAFTGAITQKIGRFELAHHGTLFLDEVGDIPPELQPKLLRALQEHEFERLGSARTIQVDVRVVAATNRDLADMVADGRFRSDLYYRLNVFPVVLPPLRERRDDIPVLVRHFTQRFAQRMGRRIETIPAEVMDALVRYPWPGNIREMQNVIERAVILSRGPELKLPLSELKQQTIGPSADFPSSLSTLEEAEREHILRVLGETNWILGGPAGAALKLGMKRTTLQSKMRKLGIARPQ
jgi:formate hydrogenlyase transcriptional activator